jgi:UDP-N-acetylglucosamine 2-epimerase
MKVVTIVGARPQFIKAAPLSQALRSAGHEEVLVHTGQHYDPALSDVFFENLDIARPAHHLDVGSSSHGRQTAQMLERIEPVLRKESPDWVVVFGDTNSTLAGSLAAAKEHVPLAHVEAGLRSFNRAMPEEINRIVADHVSQMLFAPTQTAIDQLALEGLGERAHLTGDIMHDAMLQQLATHETMEIIERLSVTPGGYALATVHRASNTDQIDRFGRILDGLALLGEPVVFPMHPRARLALASSDLETPENVQVIEPVGYIEMLALERHARIILTDSGGVQKEAYLLGVPCVTLRDETEWPETLFGGWNVLVGCDTKRMVAEASRARPGGEPAQAFGDGHSAERMVRLLDDDRSKRGCLS